MGKEDEMLRLVGAKGGNGLNHSSDKPKKKEKK